MADPMEDRITIELGERSYTVIAGEGLLDRICEVVPAATATQIAIITDGTVGPLYVPGLAASLRDAGVPVVAIEVDPGEASKDLPTVALLLDFLAETNLTRNDLVVAVGGGVVGDLTGFVASIFKRGVRVIQVPTTLMSQVDSAIGGKTGVNLPQGKNLVGTFHQPIAVLSDITTLNTLPDRQLASGLAEVAKYSFLRPDLWDKPLGQSAADLRGRDRVELIRVVRTCSRIKGELVSRDERDTADRIVLNYGHTLGHALESATGYGERYSHGEAVAVGMVFAAIVSEMTGRSEPGMRQRHADTLAPLGLPVRPFEPAPSFGDILAAMRHDKKSGGDLVMVLLAGEGKPVVARQLDESILEKCYHLLLEGV